MTHRLSFLGLAVATLVMLASAVQAQDRYAAEIYGQGVHRFHQCDLTAAKDYFNQAIQAGFNDPRAYYFRAISKLRSGDKYGAESDIRLGADLEINGSGAYNVGRALERVQGYERVRFEEMRRKARLDAQIARANRPQPALPPAMSIDTPPAPAAVPAAPDSGNPFTDDPADDAVLDDPNATDEGAVDEGTDDAGTDENPFEDDLGGDDLFSDEAPADEAPMDPPPADEDDLFGGEDAMGDEAPQPEVDEGDDPFGDEAADDLFGGEAADDLFGGEELNKSSTTNDELESLFGE